MGCSGSSDAASSASAAAAGVVGSSEAAGGAAASDADPLSSGGEASPGTSGAVGPCSRSSRNDSSMRAKIGSTLAQICSGAMQVRSTRRPPSSRNARRTRIGPASEGCVASASSAGAPERRPTARRSIASEFCSHSHSAHWLTAPSW